MTIVDLLERYQPDAGDESAHHRATVALALRGVEALDKTRFEPGHVTASAFVVCRPTRRALMIFHRRLVRWLQPGGHVEPGEIDLDVAAARELREETGLALERDELRMFDVDVHRIPATATAPSHNHYDVRFLAFVDDESGDAGSDAEHVRWVPLAELTEADVEPSIQRMTRKALAKLA